jgi:nucleotide-binding universal stress UspA family protein
MNDILCPTDLTPASGTALHYAAAMGAKLNASITLLHVVDKEPRTVEVLHQAAALVGTESGRQVREVMRAGDPLKQIAEESAHGHAYMVCATHGPKGLRQSLLGADILKLVRRSAVPTLVVQAHSPLPVNMRRIVMPVAAHAEVDHLIDAVIHLARTCGATVEVFQVMRPGDQPSEHLLNNKVHMLHRLAAEGIAHQEVNEPSKVFSAGFAEQTIRHAHAAGADCIAIMARASDDHRWIADAEKERLLTNEHGIPVLCAV